MTPLFSIFDFKPHEINFFTEKNNNFSHKKATLQKWVAEIENGKIYQLNETQIDITFLNQIFGDILGYAYQGDNWQLEPKKKTDADAKTPDAILGFFSRGKREVFGVIELKGANINLDKPQRRKDFYGSPVEQAFSYVPKFAENCRWVIVSNFLEIRLYHRNSGLQKYETFNLVHLANNEDEFRRFLFLFSMGQLFWSKGDSPIDVLYQNRREEEKKISNDFYKEYKKIREDLLNDIRESNPDENPKKLLSATQKIIDRIIFMCFVRHSIPMEDWLHSQYQMAQRTVSPRKDKIWRAVKDLFDAYDVGLPHNGKTIPAFNGGLFAPDKYIDKLEISDKNITPLVTFAVKYDYRSQLNVNILGHIFEQSISDIEALKLSLDFVENDSDAKAKTINKRKRDGVFYTPDYITNYIIKETLGEWLEEKKLQLLEKFGNETLDFWEAYSKILEEVKVIDPACGSGAFLNEAFDFLWREWQIVLSEQARLKNEHDFKMPNNGLFSNTLYNEDEWLIKKKIVSQNLYGVDLNEESVEITKLSLWLKTANAKQPLSSLSDNIQQGNSLISDPNVVGGDAFDWNVRFKDIMDNGGFDIVVGNPPYGIFISENEKNYYNKNYPLTSYKINLYILFLERMFQITKFKKVGFIIPKSLLFNTYYSNFRKFFLENSIVREIFTINERVFQDAEVGGSLIIIFEPNLTNLENEINLIGVNSFADYPKNAILSKVQQKYFLEIPNFEITVTSSHLQSIKDKILKNDRLEYFYDFKNGLNPGNIKHILISNEKKDSKQKPIIWGKDISPFLINWSGDFVNYNKSLAENLSVEDIRTKDGMQKQEKIDFALRNSDIFEVKKVVVRKTGDKLIAALDENHYYFDTLTHGIYLKDDCELSLEFLTVFLNAKCTTLLYQILHDIKGKTFAKISLDNLSSFPISKVEKKTEDTFIHYYYSIKKLKEELNKESSNFHKLLQANFEKLIINKKLEEWYKLSFKDFKTEIEKQKIPFPLKSQKEWMETFEAEQNKAQLLTKEIENLENQIDILVMQLYGLSEDEQNWLKNN